MIDGHFLLLLGTMIVCGILGGIAHYFLSEHNDKRDANMVFKYSFLGMVASLTVPFFLHLISSNLLVSTRANPSDLFILAGLCLLFVVTSIRFIEGLTRKRVPHMIEEQRQNEEKEEEKKNHPEPVTDKEDQFPSEDVPRQPPKPQRPGMSDNEYAILRTMDERGETDKSLSAVREATGLLPEDLSESLSLLMVKGWIGQKLTEGGSLHFTLTMKGKQVFEKASKQLGNHEREGRLVRLQSKEG